MRPSIRKWTAVILATCFAALSAHADGDAATHPGYRSVPPVVGGLSLVPERWRYRPSPTVTAIGDAGLAGPAVTASGARLLPDSDLRTLEAAYVADRTSFINTLRARRGLSFLTLWEGAGRCLFLGVNEQGRAGLNFVRMRPDERPHAAPSAIHALYDELTGKPRATFPEPPRLFPH